MLVSAPQVAPWPSQGSTRTIRPGRGSPRYSRKVRGLYRRNTSKAPSLPHFPQPKRHSGEVAAGNFG
ncbi:hypothetical protein BVG79_00996 [Ketogulonicigenium robustum]|uniref:Uncharacterized protein n=1 Tax=Ketogulonicigenium robustum TaxID=92947 RepID=A0A1W6NYM7_9RHOB|nr:hypothetical protein BVG79_00996 [Ketogulonicigenium robustum]